MRSELIIAKQLTMRGRMAYALACLESLAAKLNFSSPEYRELLALLWEFTETNNYRAWNLKLTASKWKYVRAMGFWTVNHENRSKPAPNREQFSDAPEALIAILGLCAAIGEAHLYGGFESKDSECYLDKMIMILSEQGVQLPSSARFQENALLQLSDGIGFAAPRSFYMD